MAHLLGFLLAILIVHEIVEGHDDPQVRAFRVVAMLAAIFAAFKLGWL